MKSRHLLTASLLAAAALLSGCNDNNSPQLPVTPPPPASMTISEYVTSLIAMVTGSACNTATPASLDTLTVTDDMTQQDANTLTVNCAS